MSEAGQRIIDAAQSGIGAVHFLNPFTGKTEPYVSRSAAVDSMLRAAAERIDRLEAEVDRLKSFLVVE